MPSIGLVANVYNEASALPGWLECHLPAFDDIRVLHAGPQGEWSTDGTVELLEKWHVPFKRSSIDAGFGAVRTEAVRYSPCEWVMILDADERFYRQVPVLACEGEDDPPDKVNKILASYDLRDTHLGVPCNWENIGLLGSKLSVAAGAWYDQMKRLRQLIASHDEVDAVCTMRRHWHDLTLRRPTQNWHRIPDHQVRVLRNAESIYFEPSVRMHEQVRGIRRTAQPDGVYGPFFDHFHLFLKQMEVDQRRHDVAVYDAIHKGERPSTWEEFKARKQK